MILWDLTKENMAFLLIISLTFIPKYHINEDM